MHYTYNAPHIIRDIHAKYPVMYCKNIYELLDVKIRAMRQDVCLRRAGGTQVG